MQKIISLICFLVLLSGDISAQWYNKKYNVTDINDLSEEQLRESLKLSNAALYTSVAVSGLGALVYIIYRYNPPVPDDDPTFLRLLLGDDFSDDASMVSGGVICVVGAASGVAFLGRSLRIKSVINNNYPYDTFLSFSPSLIKTGFTSDFYPGLTLSFAF